MKVCLCGNKTFGLILHHVFLSIQVSRNNSGSIVGGNGGRGGDVILECSPAVWDFSSLQHHVVR